MSLVAVALLLFAAGYAYLALLGLAAAVVVLPRRWLPFGAAVAPHLGWALLVALGYPLNAVLPFEVVVPLLGGGAVVVLAAVALLARRAGRLDRWSRRLRWTRLWREAGPPWLLGAVVYLVATTVHLRQGALSVLVVDSDVEHFADVVAALLHYPIGLSVAAQEGLEATPVGLAYHYVHAMLSAVSGRDSFGTALPSHFLILALGVSAVYVFARSFLRLTAGASLLATVLYAFGALPIVVASFGWGQQTAALASVPLALAALHLAIAGRDRRSLWTAGLLGALAAGSLYLATAPLVGGAALALTAVTTVRRRDLRPAGRLVAIGLIVAGAGLLSHLSAGAFLWERSAAGLLRTEELSGRSTHVFDFAPATGLAGVAPLELYADVATLDGQTVLSWPIGAAVVAVVATGAMIVLGLAGLAGTRRAWPHLPATLLVVLLYEAYLRWLRPFPYGEFKLLSTIWFILPCLAVAGAAWLGRRLPLAWLGLAVYAFGLGLAWGHALHFLSLPWGAALPEAAMAEARQIVRAVPAGASVYVSGQLTPATALAPATDLTLNRAGFPSSSARAGYLTKRWRGVLTNLLAFSGRPVYGLVQRHSTELRLPVAPTATEYLLLDAAEDPRLFGALPEDLTAGAGTLRLYRRQPRPVVTLQDLISPSRQPDGVPLLRLRATGAGLSILDGAAHAESGPAPSSGTVPALPQPVLPVGESLPGRRQSVQLPPAAVRSVVAAAPPAAPSAPGRGQLMIGFQALAPVPIVVSVQSDGAGVWQRDLALGPGLTWYTTPEVALPAAAQATVRGADGDLPATVRVVGVLLIPAGGTGGGAAGHAEGLERSAAGIQWPLLTVTTAVSPLDGTITLDAWYSYLGPREGSSQARLRDATELWIGGYATPTVLHLGPGGRSWQVRLRPGAPPLQTASDGRTAPDLGPWLRETGQRWLWLEIGPDRRAAFDEPPLAELQLAGSETRVLAMAEPAIVLPLLGEPAAPAAITEGTLVKGSGDDLFYVQQGRLRWVSGTDVLARHAIPWRLSVLDDDALWRLPVGLPLD